MNTLLCLAAAMALGLLLTRLAKKVNLPNVTAYLLAGLAVGPYCLNLFHEGTLAGVAQITSVALGFIAFSIGGEFKRESLKRVGAKALIITVFQALSALALVDVVLIVCGFDLPLSLTLGAIATATAPAATLMVVRQYRAQGTMTNTLLSVVAMDDAIGLAAFAISLAMAQSLTSGAVPTLQNMLVSPLLEIVISLIAGAVLGTVLSFLLRFFRSRANRLSLMIAAVFAGVAIADRYGLSSLLTCMAIGAAMVNLREDSEALIEGVDRWTPPLFRLFHYFRCRTGFAGAYHGWPGSGRSHPCPFCGEVLWGVDGCMRCEKRAENPKLPWPDAAAASGRSHWHGTGGYYETAGIR